MSTIEPSRIREVFARTPEVAAAWLFGSARAGTVRRGGDVDLGVLFRERPHLDLLCALRTQLQQESGIDEIDLVPLNGASPILRFEAVCGQLLYSSDEDTRAAFVSLTAREYEDAMAFAERGLRMMDRGIRQ